MKPIKFMQYAGLYAWVCAAHGELQHGDFSPNARGVVVPKQ
jgi:hypothetical protein